MEDHLTPLRSLLGLTPSQLQACFLANDLSRLDAKRVFPWIHTKSLSSFDAMTDVPQKIRRIMEEKFSIDLPRCLALQQSIDGTQKALLKLNDSAPHADSIETVFIPDAGRNTVCLSTQMGCAMGCKFCNTGTQAFTRNLISSEIMAQFFFWEKIIAASKLPNISDENANMMPYNHRHTTNIVFMGMGEPLLNYEHVSSTLQLLLDEKAHNFSRHKITVSTCGIINEHLDDLSRFGVRLAISLHAANDTTRSMIMPINNRYNIECVLGAARQYLKRSNTDHITFEYLLLSGVNDAKEDAQQLVKLLKNIRCRVNLILFNPWPGCSFSGSPPGVANSFSRILLSHGIRAIIRKSRGSDILAACGQLKIQQFEL